MQYIGKLAIGGLVWALTLAAPVERAGAMSTGAPPELTVACMSEDPKAALPEGLCDLFIERLANTYPDRSVSATGVSQDPALRLVVSRTSPRMLTARIDRPDHQGLALGTMLSDGALDDAAISRFLDQLIAANPLP